MQVLDASAVTIVLTEDSPAGDELATLVSRTPTHAPWLLPFEVANALRNQERRGDISTATASQAASDLREFPCDLWPYEPLADRIWTLRHNLTAYDAAYVALAEFLGATLVTADERLARAPGARCEIRVIS